MCRSSGADNVLHFFQKAEEGGFDPHAVFQVANRFRGGVVSHHESSSITQRKQAQGKTQAPKEASRRVHGFRELLSLRSP